MIKKTKLKKQEQSVLIGSSLLINDKEKAFDRNSYMIRHMDKNKAYANAAKLLGPTTNNELLSDFQEKYNSYRKSWHEQAAKCFNIGSLIMTC